jgi:hypothetical protein
MSVYRQAGGAGGRTVIIAAAVALLVGLLGGYLLGRSTAPDPTLAEKIAEVRRAAGPAEQGLELTATEYSEAVRDGRVVAPTEYQAAQSDIQRVEDTIAGVRADLRALSAARAAALDRAVAALRAAVTRRAEPDQVQRLSDQARAALAAALGRS